MDALTVPEQAWRLVNRAAAVMKIAEQTTAIAAMSSGVDGADLLIRGRLFEIADQLTVQSGRLAEMAKSLTENEEARRGESEYA